MIGIKSFGRGSGGSQGAGVWKLVTFMDDNLKASNCRLESVMDAVNVGVGEGVDLGVGVVGLVEVFVGLVGVVGLVEVFVGFVGVVGLVEVVFESPLLVSPKLSALLLIRNHIFFSVVVVIFVVVVVVFVVVVVVFFVVVVVFLVVVFVVVGVVFVVVGVVFVVLCVVFVVVGVVFFVVCVVFFEVCVVVLEVVVDVVGVVELVHVTLNMMVSMVGQL